MKHVLLLFSFLLCFPSWAQQKFRAHVVDATTGEALPYVSIYISKNNGTMTNEEGDFVVHAKPGDTLHISRIGYEKLQIVASKMHGKVSMKPLSEMLRGVTVTPMTTEEIIRKTVKKLKAEYKKEKGATSLFFFRSTITSYVKSRIQEGFVRARSAGNLRELTVVSGKRLTDGEGGEETYMHSTNIHKLLELGAWIKDSEFWSLAITPLDDYKRYNCSHITMEGKGGQLLYKIEFPYIERTALTGDERQAIIGSLYVDAVTYQMMRFDGCVLGLLLRSFKEPIPVDLFFDIEYKHENGFTEVSHISIHGASEETKYRALLYNLSFDGKPKGKAKKKENAGDNLLDAIGKAGFAPELWTQDIILRTEEEERIVQEAIKKIEEEEKGETEEEEELIIQEPEDTVM